MSFPVAAPAALPTVVVRPGEADRILSGHPWVYNGSILRLTQPAADGDLVQVKDHRQRLLGVGFYNSKSKINVRLLDTDRIEVSATFFETRIREALAIRKRHLPKMGRTPRRRSRPTRSGACSLRRSRIGKKSSSCRGLPRRCGKFYFTMPSAVSVRR